MVSQDRVPNTSATADDQTPTADPPADVVPIFDGVAGQVINDLVAEEIAALQNPDLSERHAAVLRDLKEKLGLPAGSADDR